MFRLRNLILPAFLSMALVGAGCETLGGGETDAEKAERRARNRAEKLDRDIDRDVRVDRDGDVVIAGERGRATGRGMEAIPRNARRVDAARGTDELMYEARRPSTIYVYDADTDRIVYTGTLRDGDRFVLDPRDNTARLNGRAVLDKDLKSQHMFRLYVVDDRERM